MSNLGKEISNEEASKILQEINKNGIMSIAEEMLKDNKIPFEVKGVHYRIRLLNLREKEELDSLRRKKFGQLLQDPDLMIEKTLIKVYKEKGIDISEIDNKINKLESEIHNKKLALGESLAKNHNQSVLSAEDKTLVKLIEEKGILTIQRSTLLEYSIENQLLNFVAEVITYLSTEIENSEGKFVRMWKTLEDFRNCEDTELTDRAGVLSTLVQHLI